MLDVLTRLVSFRATVWLAPSHGWTYGFAQSGVLGKWGTGWALLCLAPVIV